MSSQIMLYTGPGTSPLCSEALQDQIQSIVDDRIYSIRPITQFSDLFLDPNSIKSFFFPGGHVGSILSRTSIDTIKPVFDLLKKRHISYYGSCAGGMLATENLFLRVSSSNFINGFSTRGHSLLGALPCDAIAPLFPVTTSLEDFHLVTVQSHENSIPVPHIQGPAYLNLQIDNPAVKILTTYNEVLPPSSFVKFHGPGDFRLDSKINPATFFDSALYHPEDAPPILITSTHPEIDSTKILSERFKESFGATRVELEKLSEQMSTSDVARRALFRGYLKKLSIVCKPD